jgi:hypothetical protein
VALSPVFSQSTVGFLCEYHINITLIIGTSGRNVGNFKHNGAVSDMGGFRMSGACSGETFTAAVLCWLQGVKSNTEGA